MDNTHPKDKAHDGRIHLEVEGGKDDKEVEGDGIQLSHQRLHLVASAQGEER